MKSNKNSLIVLLLSGCMLFGITGLVTASGDELGLTFNDVSLKNDGLFLSFDCTVTNTGEENSESCILDFFASPTIDSIDEAPFLGWVFIPEMESGESSTYQVELSLPADLAEGEYYPTALIACYDMTQSYPEKISLTPGKGVSSYTVSGTEDPCAGIDYAITAIEIPETPSSYAALDNIEITVTYTNNGTDDDQNDIISIHAFIGDRELGPIGSYVKPLNKGEISTKTLIYLVPEFVDSGTYPLTLIIDPYEEAEMCNFSDDIVDTGYEIVLE
ncbi:MAG: hypothetical protein JXA44_06485 [Methanospirillaceae archaeon]|nr:hypothetical protein [Methanospirillaceae archaeon]